MYKNCTIIPTVSHTKKVETNNNDFVFIFSEFVATMTGNLFKMT